MNLVATFMVGLVEWIVGTDVLVDPCFISGDSLSNDPPSKTDDLKSYFVPIGSVRPMRGQHYKTPILRIHPQWDSLTSKVEE